MVERRGRGRKADERKREVEKVEVEVVGKEKERKTHLLLPRRLQQPRQEPGAARGVGRGQRRGFFLFVEGVGVLLLDGGGGRLV